MPITTAGSTFLAGASIGAPVLAPFDATNACVGVGDSETPFAITQTDLQASTNKIRKTVDAGYPTLVNNVLTFQSTYGGAEANWPWNEWGVFNALTGGTMLTRKQEYNGTKVSGQTWILQVELTFDVGT